MEKAKILVVDDDREIVRAIAINLRAEGFDVRCAYDGLQALQMGTQEDFQLMILDVMMPRLDGLSALMKIREKKNVPIIVLSAKSEDTDKILGLSMGADDYVTKPFNPMELVARVKSQIRRYTALGGAGDHRAKDVIRVGRLCYDPEERQLTADGEVVRLTATEGRIIDLLMRNVGRTFSAEEIYSRVWNEPFLAAENTVMVHIRRIREKIEINPKEPEYLKVVWGIGYKIEKK